jgi:hypothetical protein
MTDNLTDDFQTYKNAIARIYSANGIVVGAGFLVSNQYLLTCAHVVTAALGLPKETVTAPSNLIKLDFPLIAAGKMLEAKVHFWLSYQSDKITSPNQFEDIAGLKLLGVIPDTAQPICLKTSENWFNHPFRIFGFPTRHQDGIWADGVLKDTLANGWVQMEGNKAQGHRVEPGFSGAPIWDDQEKAVVGMAVAAETDKDRKVAFLLPTQVLFRAWTELSQLNYSKVINQSNPNLIKELSLAQRLKKESLEKRLAGYEKDYQSLDRDYQEAGDSDEKNRLQLKLDRKLEEIEKIQDYLNKINYT